MHDAAAMVAGGSLRAMEAILRGDVEHAFHPGGGLHHAMPDRASGFCIYDDPALAIARARRDGLRVLYVDLDVHHGDGVQAIHWDDPGVLTVSFHESGRYLFPGTGVVDELGEGVAAGTAVNVPLRAGTGEGPGSAAVADAAPRAGRGVRAGHRRVSQHGADSHAWDPLAHLRVTTTAMGEAARLVDAVAHRYAGGRWLATGGGGYDAYRVVPRIVEPGLAGRRASRGPGGDAGRVARALGGRGARATARRRCRETFDDAPNAGEPVDCDARRRPRRRRPRPRRVGPAARGPAAAPRGARPRLVGPARRRPTRTTAGADCATDAAVGRRPSSRPSIAAHVGPARARAARHRAGRSRSAAHAIVAAAAARDRRAVTAAVGTTVVGSRPPRSATRRDGELLALGVAPGSAPPGPGRAGLARGRSGRHCAEVTLAERDPLDPLDRRTRETVARRAPRGAGFQIGRVARAIGDLRAGRPGRPILADADGRHRRPAPGPARDATWSTCACSRRCGRRLPGLRGPRAVGAGDARRDHRGARARHRVPRLELERTQGFCRRHVAELVLTDRRETGRHPRLVDALYGAMLDRRLEPLRDARRARGRSLRTRLAGARKRPPCLACDQGASAVETALARLVERTGDPAWAAAMSSAPFCLDDLLALWTVAGWRDRVRADRRAPARPVRGAPRAGSRASPTTRPRPAAPADRRRGDRGRRGDAGPRRRPGPGRKPR